MKEQDLTLVGLTEDKQKLLDELNIKQRLTALAEGPTPISFSATSPTL